MLGDGRQRTDEMVDYYICWAENYNVSLDCGRRWYNPFHQKYLHDGRKIQMETMQERQSAKMNSLMEKRMKEVFARWLQENDYDEAAFLEKYSEEELVIQYAIGEERSRIYLADDQGGQARGPLRISYGPDRGKPGSDRWSNAAGILDRMDRHGQTVWRRTQFPAEAAGVGGLWTGWEYA